MAGMRVLIADDHEVVRKGVCNILRSGLKVEAAIEAVNGKEAVEKARQLNPDLVILDMAMPVLDGFSAAERIKKALRSVPIFHVLEARRTRGDPGECTGCKSCHLLSTGLNPLRCLRRRPIAQLRHIHPSLSERSVISIRYLATDGAGPQWAELLVIGFTV